MARVRKNGSIRGRVGNLIYTGWLDTDVIKLAPLEVSRPNTPAQLSQNERIKLSSKFLHRISDILKIGYQAPENCKTGMNEARSYFYKNIVTGTYPNQQIDYSKVILSRGLIPAPADYSCNREGTNVTLTWNKSVKPHNSAKTDFLVVVIYSNTNCLKLTQAARRPDGQVNINLPPDFQPDTTHVWIFFQNPERSTGESQSKISDSVYLGCI